MKDLKKNYPEIFNLFKYNGLLLNTVKKIQIFFDFYSIELTDQIQDFFKGSTHDNKNNIDYIYKIKDADCRWIHSLNNETVDAISKDLIKNNLQEYLS